MGVSREPVEPTASRRSESAGFPGRKDVVAFTTDAAGHINSWSREARRLFGHQTSEILGKMFDDLLVLSRPDDPGGKFAKDVPTLTRFRRVDGREFDALYASLELITGAGGIGHAQFITRPRQADETLADGPPPANRGLEDLEAGANPTEPFVRVESAELRYSEEARMRLLRRLVIAQEEERRRIARDLHDHLGQQLTSLRMKIEAARGASGDASRIQAMLTQADAILLEIDRDIDFLSWELRPAALDDLGLKAVLKNYVEEWSRHSRVPSRFHAEGVGDDRLAPEIEATLYRIAQEALNNVTKHAHAKSVGVVLEQRGRTMSLVVEDDGVGFEPAAVSATMLGLLGMRERATVVGGTLEIEPTAGGGTTVLARVPLHLTDPGIPSGTAEASLVGSQDPRAGGTSSGVLTAGSPGRILELQQAVAARDEFIATVAHELRNPIAPLMFQVRLSIDKVEQLARASGSVPADWARAQLRQTEQRLHRLLETLDRLLDVSRLSTGRIDLELDNVDLVEAVREVLASFEAELAVARCELRITTPATVIGWWDRVRVDQVCRNLVSNAIRFGAGQPIEVTVDADDSFATLVVRDYGIGIAPERHGAIFERFERGSEARRSGGFGIGLWVACNVCAAMGGSINVSSSVGVGSTFAVRLPRRPDQRREVSE